MGSVMRIQNPLLGDELLYWDPEDPESVKRARKRFEALVGQKHAGENAHEFEAYAVERAPVVVSEEVEVVAANQVADPDAPVFNAYVIERTPRAKGEPITEFDPDAGEILLVAAMAGG